MFQEFIGVDFWTALAVLINTLLIFFVGRHFLFEPVRKMIDSRQKEIDDMYAEANGAREQAQLLQAEYDRKLAAAAETSEQIVKDAIARGQSREEQIVQKAKAEAGAILTKAGADIAQEKKKALNEAKDEIAGLAMAIAEKVVGRELNGRDQQDLINGFIDALGDEA